MKNASHYSSTYSLICLLSKHLVMLALSYVQKDGQYLYQVAAATELVIRGDPDIHTRTKSKGREIAQSRSRTQLVASLLAMPSSQIQVPWRLAKKSFPQEGQLVHAPAPKHCDQTQATPEMQQKEPALPEYVHQVPTYTS